MARLIDPKAFRLELDEMDCIDKFGYVILPITKLNTALERSAVDAVPVMHGGWKPNPRNPYWLDCTVCGYAKPERTVYNFCPCCGADMRGGNAS